MRRRRLSLAALVVGLAAARLSACGGQATCGGDRLPMGLPAAEERVGAADVRLTSAGLGWLGQNMRQLLRVFLPDGLTFTIQESQQLGITVCPASARPMGCPFTLSVNEGRLTPTPPSTLGADLWLDIPKQDIPLKVFGSDCSVSVEAARTPVRLDLALGIDPVTRALSLTPTMRPLSGQNLVVTGTGLCAVAAVFQSFLLGFVQTELQKRLTENLDDRLCIKCTDGCPAPTRCGARDLCRHGAGATAACVAQRQGVTGQLDIAPLFGSLALQRFANVRYGFTAGGRASADTTGVALGVLGGAGQENGTCVPATPERARTAVAPPTFSAMAPDGQPYHLGFALAAAAVEDLAAAFWRSGAMCLRLTSRAVPQLTSDAFALVLPALGKLTDGQSRRVILDVSMTEEPRVRIGTGRSHIDARGQRVLDEPLLAVTLKGLLLDLHVLIEERVVRVGRVQQDVTLPLGLDFTPDGRFVTLLVGDTQNAVSNARIVDAELLGESAQSLRQAVPALLSLALPIALRGLRPIELPSLSGFGLEPRGARGEPESAPTHAMIYANLKVVPGSAPPLRAHAETYVEVVRTRPGRAEVILGGESSPSGPLEFSFRFGGEGLWSPFTSARALTLDDARLQLLGEHLLEVRARVVGRPATLDPTPARRTLRIETPRSEEVRPTPVAGCAQAPAAPGHLPLGASPLVLLVLFAFCWRRRALAGVEGQHAMRDLAATRTAPNVARALEHPVRALPHTGPSRSSASMDRSPR